MRYLITFFNLIRNVSYSNLRLFDKCSKILIILISSNRITSFIFGMPFLALYLISRKNKIVFNFLINKVLLHISLKFINLNTFYEIRHYINKQTNTILGDEEYRKNGFFKINSVLSLNTINKVIDYLERSPCYSAQVPSQGSLGTKAELFKSSKFISYDISYPLVYKSALLILEEIKFSELIKQLGLKNIHIYSINLYWNIYLNNIQTHAVQKFHRDYDGFNCYVIFVALSKTNNIDGATEILSINGESNFLEANIGEIYFFDPYFIHRANPKIMSNRLTCWIRVGEIPNLAYHQDLNFLEPKKTIYKELSKRFMNKKLD